MGVSEIITAMTTPFDREGNIDFPATKELIEHLIENGTDAIVVAGTTGESPTLSQEEKIALFQFAVQEVNGRISVIAGTGTNNTRESIELTREAEKCGVDGLMLVAPYYNRPSQEGLYEHFKAIAAATSLPIMLYNVPGRTSCNIEIETVIRLSKIDNIVSIKEASADLSAMAEIIRQTDDDFLLYSGDDSLTLPVLAIGGVGVVSVSAHIVGNEMKQMVRAFKEGNVTEAEQLNEQLIEIFNALFIAPNPTPIKAALNMKGIHVGDVRLPLVPLNEMEQQELHNVLQLKVTKAS